MSEMASKQQHVTRVERHWRPLMAVLPGLGDSTAMSEFDVHLVRARDDFDAAVLERGFVNCEVGRQVLDLTDVVVRRGVQVCCESVARGKLVVDLVFEEKHVLHQMSAINRIRQGTWDLTQEGNGSTHISRK